MQKRILALILASLMLVSATACSESNDNKDVETKKQNTDVVSADNDTTEEDAVDVDNLTDYEKRQLISDNLPDVSFGGEDFTVVTPETYLSVNYNLEIVAEDITGDACNDAIYNRNLAVENRFDVKIHGQEDSAPYNTVVTAANSGLTEYDVVSLWDYLAYVPISNKAVVNWKEVPNIDLSQPWYSESNENATINDRLYAIYSDLSTSSLTLTYSIFFNVEIMENYGYSSSDLYSMVKDGTWTFDKFSSIVSSMYEDKNGNGTKDSEDFFGFGYYINNPADVWQAAFDQPMLNIDGDEITPAIMCDKSISIMDALTDFHQNNDGYFRYTDGNAAEETYFSNDLLAMAPLRFNAAFTSLRDMESQYSMLPYPKWDEAQTNYYTSADDKFSVFVIPLSCYDNIEKIGTIFEAMSAESYKTVYPEYYDTALKGKYSSEAETAEMVDIIVSGRNFDFSFQFGESYFANICYMFRGMLQSETNDLASRYKTKEKVLEKQISVKFLPLYTED